MSSPARLHKVEDKSAMQKIDQKLEQFLMRYAYILLPIMVIILIALIIIVIVTIADMSSINYTMVESGNYYNHIKDVI